MRCPLKWCHSLYVMTPCKCQVLHRFIITSSTRTFGQQANLPASGKASQTCCAWMHRRKWSWQMLPCGYMALPLRSCSATLQWSAGSVHKCWPVCGSTAPASLSCAAQCSMRACWLSHVRASKALLTRGPTSRVRSGTRQGRGA